MKTIVPWTEDYIKGVCPIRYNHIVKLVFLFRGVNFVLFFFSNMLQKQELPGIYVIPSAKSSLCKYICVIRFTVMGLADITSC
jgi:hypothetical protein